MKLLKHKKTILWAVAAILLVLNLFGYSIAYNYASNVSAQKLTLAAQAIEKNIQSKLSVYETFLYDISALMSLNNDLSKSDWDSYIAGGKIFENHPGLSVVGYAPVVDPQELEAFAREVRQFSHPEYQISTEGLSEVVTPILYMSTADGSTSSSLGENIYASSERRAAMESARDTAEVAVTEALVPLPDRKKDTPGIGLVFYLPVYNTLDQEQLTTAADRRRALVGYVFGGIRPEIFMKGLSLNTVPDLHFQIFDHSSASDLSTTSLLYDSGNGETLRPGFSPKYSSVGEITWPNRVWHIRYATAPFFGLSFFERVLPGFIATLNLILSGFLLIAVYYGLSRFAVSEPVLSAAEAQAKHQRQSEAIISSEPRAIISTDAKGVINLYNKKAEQALGYHEDEVVSERASIVRFIDQAELEQRATEISKKTGISTKPGFDALVTTALMDGIDKQKITLVTSTEDRLDVTLVVSPLYESARLIGYEFSF